MKSFLPSAGLLIAAVVITGCAQNGTSDLLGGNTTSVQQAQTYQDLSMPPDLQLRPPGTAAAYTQPADVAPPVKSAAATAPANLSASPTQGGLASPAQPQGDVYERNGISKYNADGTPKTQLELQAELKKIYYAKQRQQNPNYGTVFNIGNAWGGG